MKKPMHSVTDYAVLQYLEAVYGIEVETLRKAVAWQADATMPVHPNMSVFRRGDVRFAVSGGTVCGVSRVNGPDEGRGES